MDVRHPRAILVAVVCQRVGLILLVKAGAQRFPEPCVTARRVRLLRKRFGDLPLPGVSGRRLCTVELASLTM